MSDISAKIEKNKTPPTIVEVGYKINCVSNVSVVSSTYEIDINVNLYWKDPRAIGLEEKSQLDLGGHGIDYEHDYDGLFNPELIVSNEHELKELTRSIRLENSKTGEVKWSVQYRGTVFITGMNLQLFPFDFQNLNFALRPHRLASDKLLFKCRGQEDCAFNRSIVHEWQVVGHYLRLFFTDPSTSTARKEYSIAYITVLGRRHPGWYINNVFLYTACLLLYSWLTYFCETDDLEGKLMIMSTTVIAIIANKFVVANQLPKVEYKTVTDTYIDYSFFMQMLTMASVFIVQIVHTEIGIHTATTVNSALFWIQVGIFFLQHLVLYLTIVAAKEELEEWHQKLQSEQEEDLLTTKSQKLKKLSSRSLLRRMHSRLRESPHPDPETEKFVPAAAKRLADMQASLNRRTTTMFQSALMVSKKENRTGDQSISRTSTRFLVDIMHEPQQLDPSTNKNDDLKQNG